MSTISLFWVTDYHELLMIANNFHQTSEIADISFMLSVNNGKNPNWFEHNAFSVTGFSSQLDACSNFQKNLFLP